MAQVRERISRDQALLDAGSVASARQLEDLQREIENLARRVSALEDAELEVMEKLEDAQTRATAAAADVAELAEAQVSAERARDVAFADIDAEVARVQGERDRGSSRGSPRTCWPSTTGSASPPVEWVRRHCTGPGARAAS